jgi:DNA (cytosine-5)-methyltransferase 1
MNHVDICAEIGGFSLASRRMGWDTIAFCEIDKFCQQILRKNFGDYAPIFSNLFQLNYASIKSFYRNRRNRPAPRIDIVTAGLPCQPFSVAGSRKGQNDARFVFPAFFDFIQSATPRIVVVENVRGLLSIGNGDVFETVAASLENIGYEVVTFCLPASSVGAPHRRDRIFIIANALRARPSSERNQKPDKTPTANSISAPDRRVKFITNPDDERRDGRHESGKNAERQISTGRGNGGTYREPAIRDSRIAGIATDTAHSKPETLEQSAGIKNRDGVGRISRNSSNADRQRQLQPKRGKRTFRRRIGDGDKSTSADSDFSGREKQHQPIESEQEFAGVGNGYWRENWREVAIATCVRGMDAKFPDWMDEFGGRINYGDKTISRQDLSKLRQVFQQEAFWQEIRGCFKVYEQENLFAVLRQLEKQPDGQRISFSGKEVAEECLRKMQYDKESPRAPQGWQHYEQFAGKHSDSLRELSFEIALATESLVWVWQKENARDNRTNRLKALGNSVVPQLVYEIFKAIEAAENSFQS